MANSTKTKTTNRQPMSPQAKEQSMISLAMDNAERQLREGTASSQIVCHYLKLASDREKSKLELEILKQQAELMKAKTAAIEAEKENTKLYKEAIAAMKRYGGNFSGGE